MGKEKIVLGLSGGVDSALSAALLQEEYEVIGLYLSIGPEANGEADAAAVAKELGIEFHVMDVSQALEQYVKKPFAAAYLSGQTPLPCAVCNPMVKFPALLALADELGAEKIATGHYARTVVGENGRALLLKGPAGNDQSYLLSRLPQDILRRVVFPLGERAAKGENRKLAAQLGLPVAEKPDSMEICFIPDDDYAAWLDRRGDGAPPGEFISPTGEVLGQHKGIHHYTLGQGRGLGVSGPHRYYVSRIDGEKNQVVLSDGSDLMADAILCRDPNWIGIDSPTEPLSVAARFRHARTETRCTVYPQGDGTLLVRAESPVRAPTPGQLAVFYDGDSVLGSAWILGRRKG